MQMEGDAFYKMAELHVKSVTHSLKSWFSLFGVRFKDDIFTEIK